MGCYNTDMYGRKTIWIIAGLALLLASCSRPVLPEATATATRVLPTPQAFTPLASATLAQEATATPQEATPTAGSTASPAAATPTTGSAASPAAAAPTAANLTPGALPATQVPTPTLAPTPYPLRETIPIPPDTLPAPMYLLANFNGMTQVWRLSPQGQLSQVTFEAEDVTGMDVSPLEGMLAYTTRQRLVWSNKDGGEARLLVGGFDVSAPHWSPDGLQLAYRLDGIKVFSLATGEWIDVIQDANLETKNIQLYTPWQWSPDGRSLLARVQLYECNVFSVATLNGALNGSFGFGGIGTLAGARDRVSWYVGEPAYGGFCANESGLWRVDARSGRATSLFGSIENGRVQLAGWPYVAQDGHLQYFLGQSAYRPDESSDKWDAPMRMVSSAADGVSQRAALSAESFVFYDDLGFGEVLWAPDGSFAILTAVTDQPPRKDAWLVKADGSPAVSLGYLGYNFRWGLP
jgi:hypothetical protein